MSIDALGLAKDLEEKSEWIGGHIRRQEWQALGFFNGYYDNRKNKVEGAKANGIRMILSSQVFPIMSGVADDGQVKKILAAADRYLWDKSIRGFHLNTDFKQGLPDLGRAFSFVYGDKENGAFFNHMIVMLAYALYSRGFVKDGWRVLSSVYNMALDTQKSKIYPCLPEYFNLEGMGMYSYLTGSASWFILTLATEVFGVRGIDGNLLIEPKLTALQFRDSAHLAISRNFCGRILRVSFKNPRKLDYPQYKITRVSLNSKDLPLGATRYLVISRKTILGLAPGKINSLDIALG